MKGAVLDGGCSMLDEGCSWWMLDNKWKMMNECCRMLEAGYWLLGEGCGMKDGG